MYLHSFSLKLLAVSSLSSIALASSYQIPLSESETENLDNGPHTDHAQVNAPHIFNALHSSMRQWGSSLKHNGMSFFAASIPNNTLLYHGTHMKDPIMGMEWLAFEIEHAEVFARMRGPRGPGRGPPGGRPGERPPPGGPNGPPGKGPPKDRFKRRDDEPLTYGYLHIYRTSRPLNKLLYLDGMSAGKTSMGTLDTQDYVMCKDSNTSTTHPNGDYGRAECMCKLGAEYGIEGIIRMEAGFELILCNFSANLEFITANERPKYDAPEGVMDSSQFEYVRGVAARYQGITAGRVKVDHSSMVSAYFYPLNLTNPDASRPDLPRLPVSDQDGLTKLKEDALTIFNPERNVETVDWQGVVDMVVTRYSDRLQYLASTNLTDRAALSEINFLLSAFIDYTDLSIPNAIETCARIYLPPMASPTQSDGLIYEAILTVTRKTCSTLFEVRDVLLEGNDEETSMIKKPNPAIQELIEYLDWSTWLECGKCDYDEVCYVAIWPWGSVEDHEKPGCVKNDDLSGRRGYWGGFGPR
ncbi:hypothetical protein IFR04_008184 [Cadophora malorum]|uniref:Uncharacterized protein n=1 Tax=Cadophora malorum TaxID=108018 RepID=A0A8H7WA26_9HELO|nr:hypothetical protein IFR04_008184 [Cadophora malorum]